MPGIHKNNTISFRPSEWEKIIIEERASVSGMSKKDFIARSCIYSNICVVGDKRNVQKIVDAVWEMEYTIKEVTNRLSDGKFPLSENSFYEMSMRYLALCEAIVEILDGASYLFDKRKSDSRTALEQKKRLNELLETLSIDYENNKSGKD